MLSITAGYYKQFKTKKKRWEGAGERRKGEKGERRKEKGKTKEEDIPVSCLQFGKVC